jgi:hypothetical protein
MMPLCQKTAVAGNSSRFPIFPPYFFSRNFKVFDFPAHQNHLGAVFRQGLSDGLADTAASSGSCKIQVFSAFIALKICSSIERRPMNENTIKIRFMQADGF